MELCLPVCSDAHRPSLGACGGQHLRTKKAKKLVKFGGGFYCGLIEIKGKQPVYVFNGFFMQMRSKFVAAGASIYYFVVEWDPATTSWEDFRGKVTEQLGWTIFPNSNLMV